MLASVFQIMRDVIRTPEMKRSRNVDIKNAQVCCLTPSQSEVRKKNNTQKKRFSRTARVTTFSGTVTCGFLPMPFVKCSEMQKISPAALYARVK